MAQNNAIMYFIKQNSLVKDCSNNKELKIKLFFKKRFTINKIQDS